MCPPFRTPHSPDNLSSRFSVYRNWVNTARCAVSLFFEHRETKVIKCPECRSAEGPATRADYSVVLRHYLHFGFLDAFERCSACRVQLASTGDIQACPVCREERPQFLDFLSRRGLHPWTGVEPTVVAISSSRD